MNIWIYSLFKTKEIINWRVIQRLNIEALNIHYCIRKQIGNAFGFGTFVEEMQSNCIVLPAQGD